MASTAPIRSVVRLAETEPAAHAVRAGSYLYTSGIAAAGDTTMVQASRIYATLTKVLEHAEASWSDVVKINYYTTPRSSTAAVRQAVRQAHAEHANQVRCALLASPLLSTPDDAHVRIELIARPGTSRTTITDVSGEPDTRPWAHAVRADETLYVSGQLPLPSGPHVEREKTIRLEGELGDQTAVAYSHHDRILRAARMRWSDAVQVHQFLTPRKLAIDDFQRARHRYLTPGRYLSTSVACENEFPERPVENCLILVDMEGDIRERVPIYASDTWGNKPGPQAFWCGNLLRMHGQVPRDLEAKTQHADDIEAQTRLTFENLTGVLRAAGVTWSEVIHIRTFCREPHHVEHVRRMRTEWIDPLTVASTDLVAEFFDPLLLVEIELVAIRQP